MEIDKNKILSIQKIINGQSPSYKDIKEYRLIFVNAMLSAVTGAYKLLNQALVEHFSDYPEEALRHIVNFAQSIPYPLLSFEIGTRDGEVCNICGEKFLLQDFHIDHIIPKSKFPCSHPWNLQLLCRNCNMDKGAVLLDMIPIFLKGAKYRTNKYIGNEQGIVEDIIYLGNMKYKTITIEKAEEIIDSIIQEYTAWVDILEFLGTVKHRR